MAKAPEDIKDMAVSVRDRLRNHARTNEQDFMVVLVAYGLERLIYRLSISDYRNRYVLKGGMLVTLWTIDPGRFTRDVDFLAFGDDDEPTLIKEFTDILNIPADDGLIFDTADITAAPIRDDQVYGGMRLRTTAHLKKTEIPITIDLGFGDAIGDPEFEVDYGSLLDLPSANIRAYSPATVMAEKFQAIVALGIVYSRMKDYYDLYAVPRAVEVSEEELQAAIKATFNRRKTDIPTSQPPGLSNAFTDDPAKQTQWAAYSEATDISGLGLGDVANDIWARLENVCRELRK